MTAEERQSLREAIDMAHRERLGIRSTPRKDRCNHGHRMVGANVVYDSDGTIRCRSCRLASKRALAWKRATAA